jgi:hypothetical protein
MIHYFLCIDIGYIFACCYDWIAIGAGEFIDGMVDGDLKMVGVHGLWTLLLPSHLHCSSQKLSLIE